MNFIIGVGNYGKYYRLRQFLSSLATTRGIHNATVLVVNTKPREKEIDELVKSYSNMFYDIVKVDVGNKNPTSPGMQMFHRLELIKQYANKDTIYCNFDDDYVFNPYWLNFTHYFMTFHKEIKYLTLLFPGTGREYEEVDFSGHTFIKVDSCMGGSFMVRWPIFLRDMETFYGKYTKDNNYDDCFWNVIEDPIYMLKDVSLYQHTWLESDYGHNTPMQGINYKTSEIVI